MDCVRLLLIAAWMLACNQAEWAPPTLHWLGNASLGGQIGKRGPSRCCGYPNSADSICVFSRWWEDGGILWLQCRQASGELVFYCGIPSSCCNSWKLHLKASSQRNSCTLRKGSFVSFCWLGKRLISFLDNFLIFHSAIAGIVCKLLWV